MAKFKICPICRTKNSPAVLECTSCGNDLMGVRVVDDTDIANDHSEISGNGSVPHQETLVKVCDCGQENELSARKCIACGEDLIGIIPTLRQIRIKQAEYVLTSIDKAASLTLECPCEHIIGREQELSGYLASKPYVSRMHARITVTPEGVFIENLSRANGTYINNTKLCTGDVYKLSIGDEIGLGGILNQNGRQDGAAYFVLGEA